MKQVTALREQAQGRVIVGGVLVVTGFSTIFTLVGIFPLMAGFWLLSLGAADRIEADSIEKDYRQKRNIVDSLVAQNNQFIHSQSKVRQQLIALEISEAQAQALIEDLSSKIAEIQVELRAYPGMWEVQG